MKTTFQGLSMTAIQAEYIRAVVNASRRVRAMRRGKAARKAQQALAQWGFNQDQIDAIIQQAAEVAALELIAAGRL
jgi:hypothetical protein